MSTMQTELIIVSEYCQKCHIEPSFIEMLEEGGLINVRTEAGKHYLLVSELPNVERYSRMYYDLSINMEGIDAIHHMLERMDDMRREITSLRKQLLLFREREIFIANRGSVHVDQSLCFIRTVTVQRKLSDVRADFFQIACIRFIKAVRCIAVYIQHSDDVSFFYNRYYYL